MVGEGQPISILALISSRDNLRLKTASGVFQKDFISFSLKSNFKAFLEYNLGNKFGIN
jgi:hypothetical protein